MRSSAIILSFVACIVGCSDETSTSLETGPTGPPKVTFSEPASGGDPVCVSIGDIADTTVPLLLAIEEIVLRPPGLCTFDQCGHLQLFASGVLNNEGTMPAIELLMGKLGDIYHDGSQHLGTGAPDVLEIRVDVIGPDGIEPLLDQDDEPVTDTIELITVPDCTAL